MALFAAMVNTIMVSFVSGGGSLPPGAPGVSFPTLAEMESPSGLMAGLAAASNIFGVVTLSFWAVATASDYSSGLIRPLVAAEPHRWRLLAGKVAALLVVTAAATTVAAAVNVVAVFPAAGAAGISTATWGTDLVAVVATAWLNLFLALCAWGVLGLVIAVLTRSAAVSISIGVGHLLVVESLIKMVRMPRPTGYWVRPWAPSPAAARRRFRTARPSPSRSRMSLLAWSSRRRVRPPGRDGLTASKTSSTRVVDEVMT